VRTTDAQVRKLMQEMTKHGGIGLAAMRAGMDRKTARKDVTGGKLPSELAEPRDWRTREDAFLEHWPELEDMLRDSPALEAKTLFEVLVEKYPERYEEGQLRTCQFAGSWGHPFAGSWGQETERTTGTDCGSDRSQSRSFEIVGPNVCGREIFAGSWGHPDRAAAPRGGRPIESGSAASPRRRR
jgi:hypothetical protein